MESLKLGFRWFQTVAEQGLLPQPELQTLLTERLVLLSPDIIFLGWTCFLTYFRIVRPCLFWAVFSARLEHRPLCSGSV